jgi:hypothetical protein
MAIQPHARGGNGSRRAPSGGHDQPEGAAPIRERGASEEVIAHCADMSYTTLCEVFEQRGNLTKRAARAAGTIFRGVGTTIGAVNSLEKFE